MKKYYDLYKVLAFLLILGLLLEAVSVVSVRMDRYIKPIYNHSATCIFNEPDNTIDVLAIGDSNTYSSICPLIWWENSGFTGYSWGEPSQRIVETYHYLKKIYRHQEPAVVFIEANNIFRDKTDADNLDSIVKACMADVFPVVTYHKSLDPKRIPNIFSDGHSLTKGYYVRAGIKRVRIKKSYPRGEGSNETKCQPVHPISIRMLEKCIRLCQEHHSEVILLSVPSYKSWNMKKHNAIAKEAAKSHVKYLDMNLEMGDSIDWKKDSCDGGDHLNIYGARKTTLFLEDYLKQYSRLTDHRLELKYKQWNRDMERFNSIMSEPEKLKEPDF